MTRTEEFLDLYKQLEQAATSAYGWEPDGLAIYRLERMDQFESRRTELSYCREVRNLLQHNCLIDGEYAVEPSEPMLALLRSLLLQITQPVFHINQVLFCLKHFLIDRQIAGQLEQLLGAGVPALGPETLPSAAGHDDSVNRLIHEIRRSPRVSSAFR